MRNLHAKLLVALCSLGVLSSLNAQVIISDSYNVTGNGTGFSLNAGVNTGINPPTTRLGGSARANVRYIQLANKTNDAFSITGNKLQVTAAPNPGRIVLSADGVTSFDFGSALGAPTASPTNRITYDISVRLNNNSAGTQRYSFAISTVDGDANQWDFGVQLYRSGSAQTYYTIGKRVDARASGLDGDLNEPITTLTPNTYGGDVYLLMRITDAGAETTSFQSRVQLSLNGGNSWFYDTASDPNLPNGWRFNSAARHLIWDVAGGAGPVTYDAFNVRLNPPESNANTTPVLRAMAYNIHWAAGPDGKVNTQRIANYILSQNVDLVGFNEVARFWSQRASGRDIIGEIAEQTGMSFVFTNNKADLSGNAQFGNAILSKYPIISKEHRLLPRVGDNEQRGWLKTVVDMNGKFISFWTTHLDFKADHTERLMCATNFNQWIDDEVFPVIFVGDFNDTPGSPVAERLSRKWTDIWPVAGDGTLGRTVPCPGPPFNARIDYIWQSKGGGLVPTNAFVGYGIEASDHYPVLSDFVSTNFHSYISNFHFPFNAGSGANVIEAFGRLAGNFTSGNAGWSADSPSGQDGDYSIYFNGARKITIPDPNQLIGTNGVNGDYTLQTYVKVAVNYAPTQRAVLFQYDRRPGFALSINTNRTLHTSVFNRREFATTATIPNDGQWHHIAVVHTSGENMRFYIDAELAATVPYTQGAGYRTGSALNIGASESGTNPFTGYLDRVRWDNRALAPSEFDFLVPEPPPTLGVRQNGDSLTLYWPASVTTYFLQASTTLESNSWVTLSSQVHGDENQATIIPASSAMYFRLRR